jgi:hypothetical protein
MHGTADVLQQMAHIASLRGIHTGNQFAERDSTGILTRHDICALAWVVAEQDVAPRAFFTDDEASIAIIKASPRAMAAIKAISDVLDTDVNDTAGQPDYIEHVSVWTMTPPLGADQPPTTSEVIGRILRAANHARSDAA